MSRLMAIALAIAASHLVIGGAARADTNMLVILDGSNSMWGQIDGTAKITTAQDVLGDLLKSLPAETKLGLMIYGHREAGNCADVELVAPIGGASTASLQAAIKNLKPKGKTPIATSLEQAGATFSELEQANNNILLISDGIETCGGDPCAVAEALAERGINLRVHVVGFDVDADAEAQLQCIAEKGQGRYFKVDNAAAFRSAIEEVRQVAEAPKPVEPAFKEYYRDDFDGAELNPAWTVDNPDPDAFIVEDGRLLAVTGGEGTVALETLPNLFRLTGVEPPKEDWIASASVVFGLQTAAEQFSIGLYEAPDDYIMAHLQSSGDKYYGWKLILSVEKRSKDNVSTFDQTLASLGCNVCGAGRQFPDFAAKVAQPIELQLVKEGRSFYARAKLADAESQWVSTDKVSSLRARGSFAMAVQEYKNSDGETFAEVDLVKIETEAAAN